MSDEMNAAIAEILTTTGETYKGLAIAAGHIAGLFDIIKVDAPITIAEIAKRKDYDIDKLRRWVHFASGINIIRVDDKEGVTLTTKGLLLSPASPVKDVLAFVDGFTYLIKSADQAENTFKKHESLDKLSDGKISKDYQPKVSDNFSISLIEHLKKFDISDSDTLLDVGCGNGSLLRALSKAFPNNHLSGIDANLFAIEKAKKENIALALQDKIKMLVGDIVDDMGEFPDNSQEWVMAINVLHFVPADKRDDLIGNLVRIARRGVFFNLCLSDANMIALTANTMMSLMWNDFTGFYTAPEAKQFFEKLAKKYKTMDIRTDAMMQGTSSLVTMLKK